MKRAIVIAAVSVLVAGAAAAPASGHVKTSSGKWLITGSTYGSDQPRDRAPQRRHRSDPVSVIWRGPRGTDASVARAMSHTEDHWRERRIPSRYPRGARMRSRRNPACRDAQHVFMRRGNQANSGRWSSSIAYMSTNFTCGNQYHIRFWSSNVHASFFGDGHRNEWALAPIHHERVRVRCRARWRVPPVRCRTSHRIDIPFDSARYVYYRTMRPAHCINPTWAVHTESQRFNYQNYIYSGLMSRISYRHRADGGCRGA